MRFQRSNLASEIDFHFGAYYVHDKLGCRITKQLIISVSEYDILSLPISTLFAGLVCTWPIVIKTSVRMSQD